MTEKNLTPETEMLTEEALEQVSGGEGWIQLAPDDPMLYQPSVNPQKVT